MSAPRIDATRLRTWVFLVPAVLLLVWLGCGPKPWSQGVAAAEARGREPKPTHYAVTGVWYGAWVALPAALVLAALALICSTLILLKPLPNRKATT